MNNSKGSKHSFLRLLPLTNHTLLSQAQWLKQQGFGGFVAWTLDTDSFHPDLCNSQSNKAFLLISAAAAVMLDSVQPGASSSSLHNVSTSSTTPSLSYIPPAPVTSPPDGVDRAETTAETATTSPSSTGELALGLAFLRIISDVDQTTIIKQLLLTIPDQTTIHKYDNEVLWFCVVF